MGEKGGEIMDILLTAVVIRYVLYALLSIVVIFGFMKINAIIIAREIRKVINERDKTE